MGIKSELREERENYSENQRIKKKEYSKRYFLNEAKEYWRRLGDIPCNEDEEIEEKFLHFEIGTDKYEIWHWFEEKYDLSVAEDLMYVK